MKICGFSVGLNHPIFLISGPCVIESEELSLETAGILKEITQKLDMPFVYKSSFDKANRSSEKSFRGLGIDEGLKILEKIKKEIDVPVLTDVHEDTPIDEVASVVDILQTPAFLCRQTNFLKRVAAAGKPVNVKKGQFLSPWEMKNVVEKCNAAGNKKIMVCERGTSFGYNNLVSDMRSLAVMRETNCPVIFDATHSVQLPGKKGDSSGGQREFIPVLARAAVATGIAGLFMESHITPDNAMSDGPNAWPVHLMENLLSHVQQLDQVAKNNIWLEDKV
ncbi:MAG: 3-deoxy-8-phosphooctulonate synthase [Pseudomonadota bacterium]